MGIDPRDVDKLQTALNDAAGKASVLWTTFITFELYLLIAFASVTHRNLFLESPIKLPLLNVDLPLVGFFLVAPALLVIFHFYVLLQLLALARKAKDYDWILAEAAPVSADRQLLRQRLDSFLILQFLAGPSDQRRGFAGLSLRLVAWITLVGAPVLILLLGQVTFLPYHAKGVTWLQRIAILLDLTVIWYFWKSVRSDDTALLRRVPSLVWKFTGGIASFVIIIFSICLATFPGDLTNDHPPGGHFWNFLREPLFAGAIDEVTGRPQSLFSNRLVLTDQSFIDPDKLDKVEVSHSVRGRDLAAAVMNRADLRKFDFTGARMDGAKLIAANLKSAQFGCAFRGKDTPVTDTDDISDFSKISCTSLLDATLQFAQLQGAWLYGVQLQRANLDHAQLQGASLEFASLQGASLNDAALQGARLNRAKMQGAWLKDAELQGASLESAMLQGASLSGAALQGAKFDDAHMEGSWLVEAQAQGASLNGSRLAGASLRNALVWRTRGRMLELWHANIDGVDLKTQPWMQSKTSISVIRQLMRREPDEQPTSFASWRDAILKMIPQPAFRADAKVRLSVLDPGEEPAPVSLADRLMLNISPREEPHNVIPAEEWKYWQERSEASERERPGELVELLADLGCSSNGAPYVARALIRNARLRFTGSQLVAFADRLKGPPDSVACSGIRGLTEEDWMELNRIVPDATRAPPERKTLK